jgi:hypothetical protein
MIRTNNTSVFNYGLDNDSKGRLHEILVARILDPNNRFPSRPNEITELALPASEELYNKLVSTLGGASSDNYKHHLSIAQFSAEKILAHLTKTKFCSGNNKLVKIYWTSNPSDFASLTRIKEKNPSDLIFESKHTDLVAVNSHAKFIGLSLKIHNKKKRTSTLANPGHKLLDRLLGVDTVSIHKQSLESVKQNTIAMGFDISNMTIKQAHALEKTDVSLLLSNAEIAKKSVIEISTIYREQLISKSSAELAHFIQSIVNTKNYKVKTFRVTTYGIKDFTHEIVDISKEGQKILSDHKDNIFIKDSSGKRTITFGGKNNSSLIILDIKPHGSGGFQSINGNVQGWCTSAKL